MIETGSAFAKAAADEPASARATVVVGAEPQRPVAEAFGRIRRRLTLGGRHVTDGAVRLPIVMTFVVAMFAATMALGWFGDVATREWRSGTNLLRERRSAPI